MSTFEWVSIGLIAAGQVIAAVITFVRFAMKNSQDHATLRSRTKVLETNQTNSAWMDEAITDLRKDSQNTRERLAKMEA